MEQRRNTEARLFHHHALQTVSGTHACFRINNMGAQWTRDLSHPQFQPFAKRSLFAHAREFIAQIAAFAVVTVFIEDQPVGMHLGELLFRGHACQ